jgi:hypothetical protein
MGMGMGTYALPMEEDRKETANWGSYECPHCGERHASDDTEIWCAINKQRKEEG